jgi:hypothetical protein
MKILLMRKIWRKQIEQNVSLTKDINALRSLTKVTKKATIKQKGMIEALENMKNQIDIMTKGRESPINTKTQDMITQKRVMKITERRNITSKAVINTGMMTTIMILTREKVIKRIRTKKGKDPIKRAAIKTHIGMATKARTIVTTIIRILHIVTDIRILHIVTDIRIPPIKRALKTLTEIRTKIHLRMGIRTQHHLTRIVIRNPLIKIVTKTPLLTKMVIRTPLRMAIVITTIIDTKIAIRINPIERGGNMIKKITKKKRSMLRENRFPRTKRSPVVINK